MPDAVEVLAQGPLIPGLDPEAGDPIPPLELLAERPPSYEQIVRLALEHLLAQSQKKLREEIEEELDSKTDKLPGTDDYVAILEATLGRRLAFRAHWLACGASEALEDLGRLRKATLLELAHPKKADPPAKPGRIDTAEPRS